MVMTSVGAAGRFAADRAEWVGVRTGPDTGLVHYVI